MSTPLGPVAVSATVYEPASLYVYETDDPDASKTPSPLKSQSCVVVFVDVEEKITVRGALPLNGFAEKLATGGSLLGPVPESSFPPPPPPPQLIRNNNKNNERDFFNIRQCTIELDLLSILK